METMPENYYPRLKIGVLYFNCSNTYKVLTHFMSNCTKLDGHLVRSNKTEFEEATNLIHPIDAYCKKRKDCQKLADDGEVLMSKSETVIQL